MCSMRKVWWPVLVAALLRVPFLFTGLSTDEGGYAYVAREWARGELLYSSGAWLDRPQGLLLAYRMLLFLNGSGWSIRLGVILAGVVITLSLYALGGLLVSRRAGLIAAWLYAVVGIAPHLEGMTFNGELLASIPSTTAIVLIVSWRRREASLWLLAGGGLLAGVALTMKQSGIDGILVGLVVAAFSGRALLAFAGGVIVPLIASVAHGLAVGFDAYWTALVGYQLSALGGDGSNASTRWADLGRHAGDIALDLTLILLVSLLGWRHLDRGGRWVLGSWLVAGFVGINLGGSYWPHYFVQPLPALVLLAAVAISAFKRAKWAVGGVLMLPTLAWLAAVAVMSPARRSEEIPYAALAARDDRIAAYVDAATAPNDTIYVLESEAYLYFRADRKSPYPYLWGKPIDKIPSALPQLRTVLTGEDRPELVILDTPPAAVDPSGGVQAALSAGYRPDTIIDGVPILRAAR
jgi:4-amino-4-deoxy-L-arabinose transferase-like glycosyltransferase